MPDSLEVPLFPLPGLLLYPGRTLPLHIFETRYRALMKDALAGDGRFAMAVLRPGWEPDYEGRPPIFGTVCVGTIVKHRALPDGRFFLHLRGDERARVVDEVPGRPYRVGRVEVLREAGLGDERESPCRVAIETALASIGCRVPAFPPSFRAIHLADEALLALPLPIERRIEIFSTPCAATRIASVLDAIQRLYDERAELGRAGRICPDDPQSN